MVQPLSIITVNLNNAAGLRATAASVAAQRDTNFEWLIFDGGSTDGSLDVLDGFACWLSGCWQAPDAGPYDAMNQGLQRAAGDYVMFMNSGDRFHDPATVERINAILARHPEIDLLFGATILDLPSGWQVYRPPHEPQARLRFGLPAYHQATVVRRALHLAAPFDLRLRISADYGAIARLLQGPVTTRLCSAPLAIRDCGPANLSERRNLARFADFVTVQRRILAKAWPEVALNLGRLVLIFLAYQLFSRWPWRRGMLRPLPRFGAGIEPPYRDADQPLVTFQR